MHSRRLTLLGCIALLCTTAAPASPKPCRDKDGKIVACDPVKKPAPSRCKDEKGRFVRCKPQTSINKAG